MFHDIPDPMLERMAELEVRDRADRDDGTPLLDRLRQIPPETGRLLAMLAASAPEGRLIEIGTSAGYSTMWLSLAARAVGRRITTFEWSPAKVALARETFRLAGIDDVVDLVEGDAREHLADLDGVGFCFLDCEKRLYADCFELVVPNLVTGGLLVADNAINHRETLQPLMDRAAADPQLDTVMVPIGMGEFICRRV
jgi:predicted O-methyltransferase YrrM